MFLTGDTRTVGEKRRIKSWFNWEMFLNLQSIMMSFVSRSLFSLSPPLSASFDGKYVFVLAETRQEERTDGGRKEKGEQRGVCLYSEPV